MSNVVVATVKVLHVDGNHRLVELKDGESVRIGRMEGAGIRLDDASVSRTHAMFTASPSGVVISDLGSTNGTYVNGRPIVMPVDLQLRDVVDIGCFKLSVEMAGTEAANSTTVSGRTMTAQLRPTQTVVLVARLRGVAAMRQDVPEIALEEMKAHWNDVVTKVITSTAGKVDKVLDGCVLAVWYGLDGAKVSADAVKAAQQIDLQTRQYSVGTWQYHERFPLTCSLVLNSGLALTGSVGGKGGMREFAVLGDTINVAFKVAEMTDALAQSVFISQDVAAHLNSSMRLTPVGAVSPDPNGDKVEVFAVGL